MPEKPQYIIPTDEEDAEIQRGIDADPDSPELTDEEIRRMRPLRERGNLPPKH